jgi:hypothetical protein
MKQKIKAHEERNVKSAGPKDDNKEALPQFLLDRTVRGYGNIWQNVKSLIARNRRDKMLRLSPARSRRRERRRLLNSLFRYRKFVVSVKGWSRKRMRAQLPY